MKPLPLDKDCFVTSITLVMVRKFGTPVLDWDPLITRDAFEGIFQIPKMPQRMFDKLQCGLSMLGTDLFTASLEGFLSCTACMNNLVFNSQTAPFVTLRHCAWGIWEYMNLNGDIDKNNRPTEKFSPEIIGYIQETAKYYGVTQLPDWLQFAQEGLNMPDMSENVELFESYTLRQQEYVDGLNEYVTGRQEALGNELKKLAADGFIG